MNMRPSPDETGPAAAAAARRKIAEAAAGPATGDGEDRSPAVMHYGVHRDVDPLLADIDNAAGALSGAPSAAMPALGRAAAPVPDQGAAASIRGPATATPDAPAEATSATGRTSSRAPDASGHDAMPVAAAASGGAVPPLASAPYGADIREGGASAGATPPSLDNVRAIPSPSTDHSGDDAPADGTADAPADRPAAPRPGADAVVRDGSGRPPLDERPAAYAPPGETAVAPTPISPDPAPATAADFPPVNVGRPAPAGDRPMPATASATVAMPTHDLAGAAPPASENVPSPTPEPTQAEGVGSPAEVPPSDPMPAPSSATDVLQGVARPSADLPSDGSAPDRSPADDRVDPVEASTSDPLPEAATDAPQDASPPADETFEATSGGESDGTSGETPDEAPGETTDGPAQASPPALVEDPESPAHEPKIQAANTAPRDLAFAPAATGPVDTARLTVRLGGEAYKGNPNYEIVVDGVKVANGTVDWSRDTARDGMYGGWRELSDDVVWKDIALDVPRGANGIGSVEVRFTNDRYGGGSNDRNLLVDRIELDGHVIEAEGPNTVYRGNQFSGGGSGERMYWSGALVFDTSDVPAPQVPLVAENQAGAVVGTLSVRDPDAGDTISYTVSDDRFEVVDGTLKLRDDIALDHEAAASVTLDVTATDAAGASTTTTVVFDVGDRAEVQINVSTGFRVAFYDNVKGVRSTADIDWSRPPDHVDVQETIAFEKTNGGFREGGPTDEFAVRVTGQIEVGEAGTYRFRTTSDDGSMLFVDGEPVVENDRAHGMRVRNGELSLEPGVHTIEVRYFENRGAAGLKVEMAGPGEADFSLLRASDALEMPTGGTIPLNIDVAGATDLGGVEIAGLPGGTMVMAGDRTALSDGNSVDLTGWDLGRLEIAPPPGFAGRMELILRAEGVLADAATFRIAHPFQLEVDAGEAQGPARPEDDTAPPLEDGGDWMAASEAGPAAGGGDASIADQPETVDTYGDDQTMSYDRMDY